MDVSPQPPSRLQFGPDRASDRDVRKGALPVPLTPLVGRDSELHHIVSLVSDSGTRLATITGAGGVGKTRLAIAAAMQVAATYADGSVFVSLASIRDPSFVVTEITRALGLTATGVVADPSGLIAHIRGRNLLIVLDNCEHVLSAASSIGTILGACPRVTILATSRSRLDLSGERVLLLHPLSQIAAMRLFEERASALSHDFVVTDANRSVVAELCDQLGCLPLALELAAARTTVLQPDAILARLRHRLPVLGSGPRDAPNRQHTMNDTMAWSHDLLGPVERALFRRLSVFTGGFTLHAARAVAAMDDVLEPLSLLVTSSLLHRIAIGGNEPRFAMLELTREYALEQLARNGEELETRHRHATHFFTRVQSKLSQSPGPGLIEEVKALEPEHGNIQAALAWAMEHDPAMAARLVVLLDQYWVIHGHFTEGREWLVRVLESGAELSPDLRAQVFSTAGWIAVQHVELDEAQTLLEQAVDGFRAIGSRSQLGETLTRLSSVMLSRGEPERAMPMIDESRHIAEEVGDPVAATIASLNLGWCLAMMGKTTEAESLLEEVLARHWEHSGPYGAAVALYFLGNVTLAGGNHPRAAQCFGEAMVLFADTHDQINIARAAEGLARVAAEHLPDRAVGLFGGAAAIRVRLGHPVDREDRDGYERAMDLVRAKLSASAFDAAWESGQRMSAHDIVASTPATVRAIVAPEQAVPAADEPASLLTPREEDVLRLLATGMTNQQIADALFISRRTVASHVDHILDKLGVPSRAAAVAVAVRQGLA